MKSNVIILTVITIFLHATGSAFAVDDWAYELSAKAKKIYKTKTIQFACEEIPKLLHSLPEIGKTMSETKARNISNMIQQGNIRQELYFAIRDAGLFQTKSCEPIIRQYADSLNNMSGVKDAIAFYFYKLGDKQKISILANDFDKEARVAGDHWTVDLFGYLDDWDISGVRLVRHAAYSDAAGSELLCSAIMWRRYLYGEKVFKDNWYGIGEKEKVNRRALDHFYERCSVER